jgi:enoyl-CoA hydratase/carnithine racemase
MHSSDTGTLLCAATGKVLVLTLQRPEALNAFDEAQFDAVTDQLLSASADPDISVVLLTGGGRAFSVGLDKRDLAARGTGTFVGGRHGPDGLIRTLASFPKPLVVAVNGMAVGFGATLLALADVVVMSTDARARFPFTALGLAPEAGSSYTLAQLGGRQRASWALLSSEWLSPRACVDLGLALCTAAPEDLLAVAMDHAQRIATHPVEALLETKRLLLAQHGPQIAEAIAAERESYSRLLGSPANIAALGIG